PRRATSGNQMSAKPPVNSQLNWLKWWPRDFTASTQGWPVDAVGAYIRLLNASWDQDGLPNDPITLRSIVGVSKGKWQELLESFLSPKFVLDGGRLRNPRLERTRAEALKSYRLKSEAGRRGNEARWHSHPSRNRKVIPMRSQCDRMPEARSQNPEEESSSEGE